MRFMPHMPHAAVAVAAVSVLVALSAAWAGLALAQGPSPWSGWNVGEAAQQPVTLSSSATASIRARTAGLLNALAIHPHWIEVSRSFDRLIQRSIDSATGFGSASKPIVSVDWEADDGRLRAVTRYLRDLGVTASRVGRDEAAGAAEGFLKRAGVPRPSDDPEVSWDQGMQSWQTLWTRRVGGAPAPEDFVSVWVLPDGELRALSDIGDEVPSAPRSTIAPSDAEAAVRALLGRSLPTSSVVIEEARLEWRHPNDFVDPTLPDNPAPGLRLVYIVPYAVTASATDRIEGVLWVDAATGGLVGGGAVP